jgi:hypothetical protein
MQDKARLGPALMTVLILLCQTVLPADAAQLMYIRVGEYESMTRLVFEFDGKVNFKGPQIRGPGRVEVDFIETMPVNPALQKMRDRSRRIEKIEFVQNKSFLRANIGLASSSFKLKSFYLFAPDRLVLDVYWTDAPVAFVTAKPPLPEKAPEAVPTPAVPENVSKAPSEPATVKPPKTLTSEKEIEKPALQPVVDSSQWRPSILIRLIGLFIVAIIIAMFIYFTFLKKKRHTFLSKNRVTPERAEQGVGDRLDQENIRTLDSKIRDELDKYGK